MLRAYALRKIQEVQERKMDNYLFAIAEFHDGLQLIPTTWCNADKLSCIWPSHMKTKFRINKAILAREMPRERSDWEELSIKRLLGKAKTYEEGLEKLTLAQDTSNIDDTGVSSDELREQKKKRRRIKAKRHLSSSSSSEDIYSNDQENRLKIKQPKILPPFPERNFTIDVDKPTQSVTNILRQTNFINPMSNIDVNNKQLDTNEKFYMHDSSRDTGKGNLYADDINNKKQLDTNNKFCMQDFPRDKIGKGNLYDDEFKKLIITKVNRILYKLDVIDNRLNMLEEKMHFSRHSYVSQECDIHFPISTLIELTSFEEQLQEIKFKDEVLNIFKMVGGLNAHAMIRNILKKVMVDTLAQSFSWTGKNNKHCFKDLGLSKIIIQAVRVTHSITDNDIAEYTSKWLAQAAVRVQRDKKKSIEGIQEESQKN